MSTKIPTLELIVCKMKNLPNEGPVITESDVQDFSINDPESAQAWNLLPSAIIQYLDIKFNIPGLGFPYHAIKMMQDWSSEYSNDCIAGQYAEENNMRNPKDISQLCTLITRGRDGMTKKSWNTFTASVFGNTNWDYPKVFYPQILAVEFEPYSFTEIPFQLLKHIAEYKNEFRFCIARPYTLIKDE